MNDVYRIFFRQLPKSGFQVLWNFPSIGNQRAGGFLCKGRVFSSVEKAVKYANSYAKHYPQKGLNWQIDTPPNTASTGQVTPVPSSQAETSESLAPSK